MALPIVLVGLYFFWPVWIYGNVRFVDAHMSIFEHFFLLYRVTLFLSVDVWVLLSFGVAVPFFNPLSLLIVWHCCDRMLKLYLILETEDLYYVGFQKVMEKNMFMNLNTLKLSLLLCELWREKKSKQPWNCSIFAFLRTRKMMILLKHDRKINSFLRTNYWQANQLILEEKWPFWNQLTGLLL